MPDPSHVGIYKNNIRVYLFSKDYVGELEESRQTLAKERGQLKEQKQKLEGEVQVLKVCYRDLCSYVNGA